MRATEGLNEAQRRAAEAGEGPVLIVAGPGTGKTKTLTARIAYLLETKTVRPDELIALTFTNKAAREMRDRLTALVGSTVGLPKICTFHALGYELLQREPAERQLLTTTEQQDLVRALHRPAVLKNLSLRELMLTISRAKTSTTGELEEPVTELLRRYNEALVERNAYDFDDLLVESLALLKHDETKRPTYCYVLVDEFQDTSELQYELLGLLTTTDNVFVIGDPNQSIYAFRGAGAEMFAQFRSDYPGALEVALTRNYRSRPEITAVANAIFPDSPHLEPHEQAGGTAHMLQTLNEYSEATYILAEVERGIGGSTMLNAGSDDAVREPREYAVLYRTHRVSRALQKAFAEAGIPYQVVGEGSPYEQANIQAVIAELRTMDNPQDLPVHDLLGSIAQRLQLPTEKLGQLLNMSVQFGSDITACLQHIDVIAEQEFYDPSVNAVTLMTIHASKGLEFPHVFLIAAEEGIIPKGGKGASVDEEKRLLYVAVTRAKEHLEVLHTKGRLGEPATISRFITELPDTALPRLVDPDMQALEHRAEKRQRKRAQTSLF